MNGASPYVGGEVRRGRLKATSEARALWEAFALAKMEAEDSLLFRDGLKAAQAFYDFVEVFMPQSFGSNVIPLQSKRRLRGVP